MTDKKVLFIDGKEVEFTDEPNLLEVIRKAGLNVPTFCYRPDLTQFGACRMCVVEVEYPIKIPFLQCIFLILLLRLLFVVLPRSISANYNNMNIEEGACIV